MSGEQITEDPFLNSVCRELDKMLSLCHNIVMTIRQMTILKSFQKAPAKGKIRREYFEAFEKKMAYRTTKTERPEVTVRMVEKVFQKATSKRHG